MSSVGNAIVSRINLLNLIQTGIGTTISQQLYEFNPGEVQYGKVEDVLKRRTDSETNAKGIIDTAVGSIASITIPNKIGGGRITLPETAQAVVATGEAVGVGGKVITLPVIGTGGAKAMLIVNAIGNRSKDSEKVKEPSNKNQEEIKLNSKEKRPSYKESEKDIHEFLKEKYKNNENVTVQEQTSFKGGDEAKRYGEKGSVRPDDTVIMKTETKNGVVTSRESYEVKNYKIEN
ncbi:MAG: hypothetical protein Q4A58_08065, partial [Fusobacterium sp.]|uniref:hypothetical protein n=1 Tax=Fusobacterium sp. TaxID=68766 RepID=UPI0026DAB80D